MSHGDFERLGRSMIAYLAFEISSSIVENVGLPYISVADRPDDRRRDGSIPVTDETIAAVACYNYVAGIGAVAKAVAVTCSSNDTSRALTLNSS